jgi:L-ascorbate metabolism protein UlaG (beta-lactamase superfamily)
MRRSLLLLVLAALLASACAPSATPEIAARPTAASAASPTVPPTDPLPSAEPAATLPPTAVPTEPLPPTTAPTAAPPTPTPAIDNAAPVISGLDDQTVPDDEGFPPIFLDEHVADADHADDAIAWSLTTDGELRARILASTRQLRVSVPDAAWRGSETVGLQACDPLGACDAAEIVFTVLEENDAPVVHILDQAIALGKTFPQIALDQHVSDVDSPVEELAWTFSGNEELAPEIRDRVLTVSTPEADWSGMERIQLQACDAGGACGSADVAFTVLADEDLLITFTSNAGFMIMTSGKKILIDALYPGDATPETLARMENGEPPFDGVDLVLATHDHADHFGPQSVGRHLSNNPAAVFLSTESAVEMLREGYDAFDQIEERVIPISVHRGGSVQETVNGIELEMLNMPHGIPGGYLNMGIVMTIGPHRIFHTGDSGPESASLAYFLNYDLAEKHIDVAFVSHFHLVEPEWHPFLVDAIQARYVIPMHYLHTLLPVDYEAMEQFFPESIAFHEELESWLMPRQ